MINSPCHPERSEAELRACPELVEGDVLFLCQPCSTYMSVTVTVWFTGAHVNTNVVGEV